MLLIPGAIVHLRPEPDNRLLASRPHARRQMNDHLAGLGMLYVCTSNLQTIVGLMESDYRYKLVATQISLGAGLATIHPG